MIPASHCFDQSTMATLLEVDPLVADYRAFFSLFDWSVVERWQAHRSVYCGSHGHPITAYLKAFLLRINQRFIYTTQLRDFLLKHPLLIIELGFHLVLDESADYGFDVEATLPCRYWLGEKLRPLDQDLLQALLHSTVRALQEEIPGLGETVAFDVKHIYAWVKENNSRVYVKDRYDKTRQLVGDPDCRLGVKKRSNQEATAPASSASEPASSTTPTSSKKQDGKKEQAAKKDKPELIWGYGTGVASCYLPDYGDVVLAEYTQPFNENDVTYFRPLYDRAVLALAHFPTHLTADAAFDAWYIYECAARQGGIAAIPLNGHGHADCKRDVDAVPFCRKGLRMVSSFQFEHTRAYRAQRFCCPLLAKSEAAQTCDHPQFLKGVGCRKDCNWELGGRMRVMLDRSGPLYHAIYTQRTSAERINSQAKELGIERPKVRNGRSVTNLNTLTYLIINVRALKKAKSINRGLLPMS